MPTRKLQIVQPYVELANDDRTSTSVPWGLMRDPRLKTKRTARLLAVAIGGFMSNGRQECHPSVITLSEILGVTERSVLRAIQALESTGWLDVERRSLGKVKQTNIYRWSDPKTGKRAKLKSSQQMEAALFSLYGQA